jgi:hypothetical protein
LPRLEYTISTSGTRPNAFPPALRRIARLVQIVAGALIAVVGLVVGGTHLSLVFSGAHASGRIVGFKTVNLQSRASSLGTTAHIPIVEYRIADRVVRFPEVSWRHDP